MARRNVRIANLIAMRSWGGAMVGGILGMTSGKAMGITQDEVLRSIEQHVQGEPADIGKLLGVICIVAGTVILLALWSQRREQKEAAPTVLNDQGKLLKEVAVNLDLKGDELKQLKKLAEEIKAKRGVELQNPLVLLLCPSLVEKLTKE